MTVGKRFGPVCSALCLIIVFCLLFSGCKSDGKTELSNGESGVSVRINDAGSRKVVALGDSIAAGYGLQSDDYNYVTIFAKNIGATVKNHAVSGYTTNDLLLQLKGDTLNSDIRKADVIIISIGGNDIIQQKDVFIAAVKARFLSSNSYFTPETDAVYSKFEAELSECLAEIRSVNSKGLIIVQTLYNPVLKQGFKISGINVANYINKYINRLNESIKTAVNGKGNSVVFDITDRMNADKDNFYDVTKVYDDHPTQKGHSALAQYFTDDFNALINGKEN